MPKFEGPYRVLEINGNNLIIWKSGRRVKVNIDQVRVYRPRQTDTISSDSPVETLYDEQEISNGSNRSNQGQFKEHRKTSSQKSEGYRSRQGNTTREIPRNKRKMSDTASKDQVLKRSKLYRKRSLQGSEHQDRKRRAPEQRQGVKRSIPSSISSRTYKFKRTNTSSPGVESIAGPSKFPDRRRTTSTTIGSRTEGSGRDDQTRQTRVTTIGRNKQAEKKVRSITVPDTMSSSRQGPVWPMLYLVSHIMSHTDEPKIAKSLRCKIHDPTHGFFTIVGHPFWTCVARSRVKRKIWMSYDPLEEGKL
ncbi:uncharacterized protein TNCV_3144491 [Trichonephila clavipes]|nr:uncharacterized protein TNCV_3144491 [Trichonephila clavipes]